MRAVLLILAAACLQAATITITASDGSTATLTIPDAAVPAFVKPRGRATVPPQPAPTLAQAAYNILLPLAKQANRQAPDPAIAADQAKLAADLAAKDAQVQ